MPSLTIVIGANGAGKSTWCSRNRHSLPVHFYNADSIAQGLGSHNDPTLQRTAREWVDRRTQDHLKRNESFGFESTYSGRSRPDIVRRAHAIGYAVNAVFIGTISPQINILRVASRVRTRTGHEVPSDEIIRRWTACQENLLSTAKLFANIHILDNSTSATLSVARVSGRVVTRDREPLPLWASELVVAMEKKL